MKIPSTCRFNAPLARLIASFMVLAALPARAQTKDTPIFLQGGRNQNAENEALSARLLTLKEKFPVIEKTEIDQQRLTPKPSPVTLVTAGSEIHSPEKLAKLGRQAGLRVGYLYLCPKCEHWHFSGAGGYAIAEDVIVTCDHVLEKKTKMREGYFVAIDHNDHFVAATAILARNQAMDVAILRVAGDKLTPVPLQSEIRQGASAYCFSTPLGQMGYFSTGIVNRFYWNASYRNQNQQSIDALLHLRMDLSTDWAPGSSGSPLLDQSGNVIGHVSTIAGLGSGKEKGGTQLTLHTAIPARCVQQLAATLGDEKEILRVAGLGEKPDEETKPAE